MLCATFILIKDTLYYDTFLSITCFLVDAYALFVCIAATVTVFRSNITFIAAAAITVSVIIVLAAVAAVVVYCIKCKRGENNSHRDNSTQEEREPFQGKYTRL